MSGSLVFVVVREERTDMSKIRSAHAGPSTISRRTALKLAGGAGAAAFLNPYWLRNAVAQEGQPGGSITVVTEADWVDMDPHLNGLFAARQASQFAYESLTQFDDNLNPIPALAESWESNEDSTVFTFKLRQGVTWHDGSPFTAEDVTYSFDRVLNPDNGAAGRSTVAIIESIEIVDPATVRFNLSVPKLFFPAVLANLSATAIIKSGSADAGDLKQTVNGTGPFTVEEIKSGDYIRFKKNPNYWNQPLPYVDELILKLMVEEDTRVAWIRSGQADYIDLYAEAAARLEGQEGVSVIQSQKAYMMGIRLNCAEGTPLSDGRVRKALDMAMDRQDMIEKARFGAAELTGFIPAGYGDWSISQDQMPAWYAARDVEGAKALMAEAQVTELSFGIKCSRPEQVAMALVAQENWKELGVNAEVVQMEYGAYFADVVDRNFEAIVVGNTFNPDPTDYLYPWFHSEGSQNSFNYSNPELDAKLEEARGTTDDTALKQLHIEIQQMLWEDGAPYVYAYNAFNLEGLRDRLKGYVPSYTAKRWALVKSWVEE
jgi:peptide/nickel transport system substrate-binding protein